MTTQNPGLFIAFEGGDGAGKSTQAAELAAALESRGLTVLRTREPGGTPIGEKLRSLVLDHGHGHIDAHTEALIFAASRAAHASQVIRPALERGEIVLTDRYIDSSVAYQGAGRDLGTDAVRDINDWATSGLQPDLTVLLDVDPEVGRRRRTAGDAAEDRLESEADEFHARIRTAFLDLAAARPEQYLVLPAHLPVDRTGRPDPRAGRVPAGRSTASSDSMSVWDDLQGQPAVVAQLRQAAQGEGLTHAWLFTGPPGSGRSNAAKAFAAALNCDQEDVSLRGCGECAACLTILGETHSDVAFVRTEKVTITIDEARELVSTAGNRPSSARWRIIVVEDADRMAERTTNVLLKAIEEPTPRTVWMLCAPSPADVLVTIRSRCRPVALRLPPAADVAALLVKRDGVDPAVAERAARAAQSHVGIARRLARDPEARERRLETVRFPLCLRGVTAAVHDGREARQDRHRGSQQLQRRARRRREGRACSPPSGRPKAARCRRPCAARSSSSRTTRSAAPSVR